MGASTSYSAGKTIVKTVEIPAVIIAGSKILSIGLNQLGIELDQETSYIVASSVYGVFKGFANWIKNRKNGKR